MSVASTIKDVLTDKNIMDAISEIMQIIPLLKDAKNPKITINFDKFAEEILLKMPALREIIADNLDLIDLLYICKCKLTNGKVYNR